jgi:hypothetical protein
MLKIWICGAGGRVGRKMTDILASRPVELLLTDADSVDITDSEAVMEYAHINRPHYIVNCAGLTPDSVSSCLINSNMTDFPQRRIPVMTLINSVPINGRIRFIYSSRLIISLCPLSVADHSISHLRLKLNEKIVIL